MLTRFTLLAFMLVTGSAFAQSLTGDIFTNGRFTTAGTSYNMAAYAGVQDLHVRVKGFGVGVGVVNQTVWAADHTRFWAVTPQIRYAHKNGFFFAGPAATAFTVNPSPVQSPDFQDTGLGFEFGLFLRK